MDEQDLAKLVWALLDELDDPERSLSTIARDFDECGIDYCVIGSLAVRIHNYLRAGDDIDVLISRDTYPKIEEFLIGNGYSRRPGSTRHLYYEFPGGRVPLDVYVEGEEKDGFPLPDPRTSRVKFSGKWYASLLLLITLKLRRGELRDVIELVEKNGLGEEFVESLAPDARDKFLEIVKHLETTG